MEILGNKKGSPSYQKEIWGGKDEDVHSPNLVQGKQLYIWINLEYAIEKWYHHTKWQQFKRMNQLPDFKLYHKAYSNQNSVALA